MNRHGIFRTGSCVDAQKVPRRFTQLAFLCTVLVFNNILQLNLIRIHFRVATNFRLHFRNILFSNIISHRNKTRKCLLFEGPGGECGFSNKSSVVFSVIPISCSLGLLLHIIFGKFYVVIKFYKMKCYSQFLTKIKTTNLLHKNTLLLKLRYILILYSPNLPFNQSRRSCLFFLY